MTATAKELITGAAGPALLTVRGSGMAGPPDAGPRGPGGSARQLPTSRPVWVTRSRRQA